MLRSQCRHGQQCLYTRTPTAGNKVKVVYYTSVYIKLHHCKEWRFGRGIDTGASFVWTILCPLAFPATIVENMFVQPIISHFRSSGGTGIQSENVLLSRYLMFQANTNMSNLFPPASNITSRVAASRHHRWNEFGLQVLITMARHTIYGKYENTQGFDLSFHNSWTKEAVYLQTYVYSA